MKTEKKFTACEKGPYPWIPANCQEDKDGNWYFYIRWYDHEFMGIRDGWEGVAACGTVLFHPLDKGYDEYVTVLRKGNRKRWGVSAIADGTES